MKKSLRGCWSHDLAHQRCHGRNRKKCQSVQRSSQWNQCQTQGKRSSLNKSFHCLHCSWTQRIHQYLLSWHFHIELLLHAINKKRERRTKALKMIAFFKTYSLLLFFLLSFYFIYFNFVILKALFLPLPFLFLWDGLVDF